MFRVTPYSLKILVPCCLIALLFYYCLNNINYSHISDHLTNITELKLTKPKDYNVWLIFAKAKNTPLQYKFHNLLENILNVSTVPVKFHIIVDESSKELAMNEISDVVLHSNKAIFYKLYDLKACAKAIRDIVAVMTPHFSSTPGTYYSDALFYMSLGLHMIAPRTQQRAVMLDCDLYLKKDIRVVFDEFERFKPTALFGLAPELTPVYMHILQRYRTKHKTTFGEYYNSSSTKTINDSSPHFRGYPGYNSGVVLINLSAIRKSKEFPILIRRDTVNALSSKYYFKGHLGDQDFYTLIGFEHPHLIQTLSCGFNRQLCTWWRDHGYVNVFKYYFKCTDPIVILHGNCNTKIPKED